MSSRGLFVRRAVVVVEGMPLWRRLVAELYGTFVLVGVGCGAIIGSVFLTGQMVGGNLLVNGVALEVGPDAARGMIPGVAAGGSFESKIITIALAFGLALAVAYFTVGRLSGGHFNPAVSLGMFLDRRVSLTDMVGYWIAQLAGAFLAMVAFWWVLGDRDSVGVAATTPNREAVDEFGGFVGETVFAMVLVLAYLVLTREGKPNAFGLGMSYSAIIFVGFAFTGGAANPARTLAPGVIGDVYDGLWFYLVGPLVGAVLAWLIYKTLVEGDTDLSDDVEALRDSV
ncbi:MAG: aquaporin [Acidimicrobiia bacterium]|nr:aquaporin [Acidimicrobiia bacterium]